MTEIRYTVSESDNDSNIDIVMKYMEITGLTYRDMCELCGIRLNSLSVILGRHERGSVLFWKKIANATRLKLRYSKALAEAIPVKKSKEENYLVDMVLDHLNRFGNTCLDDREIEKFGSVDNIIKALQGYGANVEAYQGESGWCVQIKGFRPLGVNITTGKPVLKWNARRS